MKLKLILIAVVSLFASAPAFAQQSSITCSSINVLKQSPEELLKLRETCLEQNPPTKVTAASEVKNWTDMMKVYAETAKRDAAVLGLTPAQYMQSPAGRLSLAGLWLKVYRNFAISVMVMLLFWIMAYLASCRITRGVLTYETVKVFGVIPWRRPIEFRLNDLNHAGWATIGFAVIATVACGIVYLVFLS